MADAPSQAEPSPSEFDFLAGNDSLIFRRVLAAVTLLLLAYVGMRWLVGIESSWAIAPWLMLVAGAIAWWLNRRGAVRASFVFYFWALWIAVSVQAAVRGGIGNPVVFAYTVLMLLGGWSLGLRQGIALGVASIAASGLMVALQLTGRWTPLPPVGLLADWFTGVVVWCSGLLMMVLLLPRHWAEFGRARDLNRELSATVQVLEARTRELERSEARYSRIRAAAPVAIAITRVLDGKCADVNPAWVQLFGWSHDEAVGRTSLELGMWPDPAARTAWIDQFRRDGRTRDYSGVFQTKDGRHVQARLFAEVVEYDEEHYVVVQFLDDSARHAAQAHIEQLNNELAARVAQLEAQQMALERSEERLARVGAASPLPLTISTLAEGRYVEVNPAWERDFGWRREEAIGRTSLEIGFWKSAAERDAALAPLRRGENMRGDEIEVRRRDGSMVRMRLFAELDEYRNERVLIALFLDDSERLAAQAKIQQLNEELEVRVAARTQELAASNAELKVTLGTLRQAQDELLQAEKMSSLGRLVAGVAHELNTPIGNALTAATTMEDSAREFAQALEGGSLKRSHLMQFVDHVSEGARLASKSLTRASDLLASFKKVAVDQSSERRRRFDLAETIGEVIDTLRPSLKHQPWNVQIDIPDGISMESYPGPLDQVIINLVVNATLHAFEGRTSGTITLSARNVDEHHVEVVCADDGVGISAENLAKVFDPFFTTKLGQGGSGLGLAIVHRLTTRLLAGQIAVESTPGTGTRFVLTLPLTAPGLAL